MNHKWLPVEGKAGQLKCSRCGLFKRAVRSRWISKDGIRWDDPYPTPPCGLATTVKDAVEQSQQYVRRLPMIAQAVKPEQPQEKPQPPAPVPPKGKAPGVAEQLVEGNLKLIEDVLNKHSCNSYDMMSMPFQTGRVLMLMPTQMSTLDLSRVILTQLINNWETWTREDVLRLAKHITEWAEMLPHRKAEVSEAV